MNLDKLYEAQASFLMRYPDGFNDPAMATIRKKHNVNKMVEFPKRYQQTANAQALADAMLKIVSRSSWFRLQPPFQRFIDGWTQTARHYCQSHVRPNTARKKQGFERLVDMLGPFKLAKWAVVSPHLSTRPPEVRKAEYVKASSDCLR